MKQDGRVWLSSPSPLPSGSPSTTQTLAGVPVPLYWTKDGLTAWGEQREVADRRRTWNRTVVESWLGTLSHRAAQDILLMLHDVCAHCAPLVLYVEDGLFSNFRVNNLTGKVLFPTSETNLLLGLQRTPPGAWDLDDATFVYCAQLAVEAFGPPGLEEFNSVQFVPSAVFRHLAERADAYRCAGFLDQPATFNEGDEAGAITDVLQTGRALAGQVRAARERASQSHQRYRRIWGVNLHKEEQLLPEETLDLQGRSVMAALDASLSDKWGRRVADFSDYAAFLSEWIPHVVAADEPPRSSRFANAFEELLHDIVRITVELSGSDIGMSRGLRSLLALIEARENEAWEEIVAWELPHYYCCVVPSARTRDEFGDRPEDLADIVWAIAARMEYNAWHFLPGNLPMCAAVDARDLFFPPSIPDISEWSDQHHRGHVVAGVRFSIRAPAAVTIADHMYTGFVDVRLMRRSGVPFTLEDLASGVVASRLVAMTVTSLAAEVERQRVNFRVESFDADWYATELIPSDRTGPASTHA